jgi:hypothetical protein
MHWNPLEWSAVPALSTRPIFQKFLPFPSSETMWWMTLPCLFMFEAWNRTARLWTPSNLTNYTNPRRLTTLWASTACYRDSFTFYLYLVTSTLLGLNILLSSLFSNTLGLSWTWGSHKGDCLGLQLSCCFPLALLTFRSWIWRQYFPPKRCERLPDYKASRPRWQQSSPSAYVLLLMW